MLKILTGGRQISWIYTKRGLGAEPVNLRAPDYTSGDPNHLHVGSIQKEIHKFNLKEQYWRIILDCINLKVLSSYVVL